MADTYGIIYCVTNVINGRQYVGQTIKTLTNAKCRHSKARTRIGNAIRFHGISNFKWEQLDAAYSKQELNEKEVLWIDRLKTLDPLGYNLSIGGNSNTGFKHSKETIATISENNKGKHSIVFTLEHCEAIALANSKPQTLERRNNTSKAVKEWWRKRKEGLACQKTS